LLGPDHRDRSFAPGFAVSLSVLKNVLRGEGLVGKQNLPLREIGDLVFEVANKLGFAVVVLGVALIDALVESHLEDNVGVHQEVLKNNHVLLLAREVVEGRLVVPVVQ
jgi:hypothetical protein